MIHYDENNMIHILKIYTTNHSHSYYLVLITKRAIHVNLIELGVKLLTISQYNEKITSSNLNYALN